MGKPNQADKTLIFGFAKSHWSGLVFHFARKCKIELKKARENFLFEAEKQSDWICELDASFVYNSRLHYRRTSDSLVPIKSWVRVWLVALFGSRRYCLVIHRNDGPIEPEPITSPETNPSDTAALLWRIEIEQKTETKIFRCCSIRCLVKKDNNCIGDPLVMVIVQVTQSI